MNRSDMCASCDVDIMSVSKLFFFLLILLVFTAPIFVSEGLEADDVNVVVAAIDRAEVTMVSAYEAVWDAEQTGANVSGLLVRLNVAGENLVNAHIWYGLKDFENATRFADLCYDIGDEVRNEAYELKSEAHGSWVRNLWLSMTISLVGVISVVFSSFLVWRVFKRRYRKRVLGMKPEVVFGES